MAIISIDGREIEAKETESILQASLRAGIYIPHLCSHPDIDTTSEIAPSPFVYTGGVKVETDSDGVEVGCNLCYVKLKGKAEPVRACKTLIEDGMEITTNSDEITRLRNLNLARILSNHPHSCITCAQREGCSLTQCSSNVPTSERCCEKFGDCELERLCLYLGVPMDTPKYIPQERGSEIRGNLFILNHELCIGCVRCVRMCSEYGSGVLGYVVKDGRIVVGNRFSASYEESGCRFCGLCVAVCPTGALLDLEPLEKEKAEKIPPCINACPLRIVIPGFLEKVRKGDIEGAFSMIMESAPLPGVLGYACQRPCEDVCRRGRLNSPVAICDIKRFIVDFLNEKGMESEGVGIYRDDSLTKKKVAIIGAGPAGLTAAYYLRREGYMVTLFDKEDEPGGMLRYAIPPYRLPKDVLDRDISRILDMGVDFQGGKELGKDISLNDLKNRFDAVLVATGAGHAKRLSIEGEDSEGVIQGLEILRKPHGEESQQKFYGMDIGVVGGGNVALDVARTSIRLGAMSVTLLCLEKKNEMPATDEELKEAEEEGVRIINSIGPIRIKRGKRLKVTFSPCLRVFDEAGQFAPVLNFDEEVPFEFDKLILAIGQVPDIKGTESDESIFFAGDCVHGSSTIPQAMASGRDIASKIDRFLGGKGISLVPIDGNLHRIGMEREENFGMKDRVRVEKEPPLSRRRDFRVIRHGLTLDSSIEEAGRCLSCHLRFLVSSPVLPPERVLLLSYENFDTVPNEPGAYRLYDTEKRVFKIKGVENLREALDEELRKSKKGRYFDFFPDPLYSKKESELLQEYIKRYSRMPEGEGDELDDLY